MQQQLILIVGILCLAFGVYSLITNPQNTITTSNVGTVSLPPTGNSTNSEVVYTGTEEGVSLGTVQNGQTITVTHIGGKIISNTETGWSSPLWGVPQSQTDPMWVKGLPYKEMNTDAVFIQLGGQRTPFKENQTTVSATNKSGSSQEVRLKMNDSRYWENTGDARFQVRLSNLNSVFRPKKTVPRGQMLGDAANGLYYANPSNSLEAGVAYKFSKGEAVYIYDGQKMRGVSTGDAYFNFYGCSKNMRIIDCAPVYLMPTSVTGDMLNGEVMK